MHLDCRSDSSWLEKTLASLDYLGFAVVENVVPDDLLGRARQGLYDVQAKIGEDVGQDRLDRAGELGVLRLMLAYDSTFIEFLELPEVLAVVDNAISDTSILHLQNGFVLPSKPVASNTAVFQQTFHRDFPRQLNGFRASLNTFFAIDEFSAENGGTIVVPGTHQRAERPPESFLEATARTVVCPAGSMIVFDSTLWHAAGENRSGRDRLGINQQFTHSWIKQQMDYVRALGDDFVERQQPRTQQLLGWYTRVVTSLDDYYQPPEHRLYRSGQG